MKKLSPIHPSEEVKQEAAAWVVRLHADDRSSSDELAFHNWLKADPTHAAAFEVASVVWDSAGALPLDLLPDAPRGFTTSRRSILAGVSVIITGAGAFGVLRSAQAKVYQTEVGEQKHVTLADGSQMFLDTDTCVHVDFSRIARAVELEYGRANFRVLPNARRPFVVSAAHRKLISMSSSFDVSYHDKTMSVVLIDGSAALQPVDDQQSPVVLRGGERIRATAQKTFQCDRPRMAPLVAWQTGRAIFENERLADAIQEMNRYSIVKLKTEDGAIARITVSGIYKVGDNLAFASAISKLLPVRIRQADNIVYLSLDPKRQNPG